MCSKSQWHHNSVGDIESLLSDKKDDINFVNDNLEIYKKFIHN